MTTRNDPILWPKSIGLKEGWVGKKPLGCEIVHAHVLFRENGGVWVQAVSESRAVLLGRAMQPCEAPSQVVRTMVGKTNNLPEDGDRWVRSVARPKAAVQDGVCHIFIEVEVKWLTPVAGSGLVLVPEGDLPGVLDAQTIVLMQTALLGEEVAEETVV